MAKFRTVLTEDDTPMQVHIDNESKYSDIVFNFKTIAIKDTWFGNAKIRFTYEIIDDPNNLVEKFSKSDTIEFQHYLGDILLELVVGTNEGRNGDTAEPDSLRALCEEDLTPPEE